MNREPLKIEELLERIGAFEAPDEPVHRYELRRALLCSRFFEASCCSSRWNRLFSFTAPLVAGGVMVGVFGIFAILEPVEDSPTQRSVSFDTKVVERNVEPIKPLVSLVDFNEFVPQEQVIHFEPLSDQPFALAQ